MVENHPKGFVVNLFLQRPCIDLVIAIILVFAGQYLWTSSRPELLCIFGQLIHTEWFLNNTFIVAFVHYGNVLTATKSKRHAEKLPAPPKAFSAFLCSTAMNWLWVQLLSCKIWEQINLPLRNQMSSIQKEQRQRPFYWMGNRCMFHEIFARVPQHHKTRVMHDLSDRQNFFFLN